MRTRATTLAVLVASIGTAVLAIASPAQAACSWSLVKSPNPATYSSLWGVVSTANGAWAVGNTVPTSGPQEPLVVHAGANGVWHVVSTPHPQGGGALGHIDGVSTDLWAVGNRTILHDNGSWHIVKVPAALASGGISTVARVAAKDVWLAGFASNSLVTLRWNGARWSKISFPDPSPHGTGADFIQGLSTIPGGDHVIAVGAADSHGKGDGEPFAALWNGSKWKLMDMGKVPATAPLTDVSAVSATNAWAAGASGLKTVVLHWNGTRWVTVKSASPDPGGTLSGISAGSAKYVWGAGSWARNSPIDATLVEHLQAGPSFVAKASPNPANASLIGLVDVSVFPGSPVVWAVGSYAVRSGPGNKTLIERYC